MVELNGTAKDVAAGTPLLEVLQAEGYDVSVIATQVNGDIVPRDSYASHELSEGDVIDVVAFVGGGCR
ncbi:MAG: sulfur carrier protein ThiS [Coriobacteriales bacterium]